MMKLFRCILYVAIISYWAFMCFMTHSPKPPPIGPDVGDKVAHFLAYGLFSGMLYVVLWVSMRRPRWVPLIVLAVALGYGALDEITQPPFGRTADFRDWLSDTGGAAIAVSVLGVLQWALSRRCSVGRGAEDRPPVLAAAAGE